MSYSFKMPPDIPPEELETRRVLKKLGDARAALAELKGVTNTIPNERILLDTLSLQEAKDSSAVENIVTTQDELFQSYRGQDRFLSPAAKEVHNYAQALKFGYEEVKEHGVIRMNLILRVQEIIKENEAGIRKMPGTVLKNELTGETIFTPPEPQAIDELLKELEVFMNEPNMLEVDPLVKMALIHHQFESIHPFYDGNGRAGRILNVLYLLNEGYLDLPVLYLSRYIIRNRQDYYRLLQEVREKGAWEEWTLYMLDALSTTSRETVELIKRMRDIMQRLKHKIREEAPKIYSQDLINNLFRHPYTRVPFLEEELQVHMMTARRYLKKLTEMGVLDEVKIGRAKYYVNRELFELLQQGGGK